MSFSKKYWAIHSRISLTFHASRKNKRTAYDLWQKKRMFLVFSLRDSAKVWYFKCSCNLPKKIMTFDQQLQEGRIAASKVCLQALPLSLADFLVHFFPKKRACSQARIYHANRTTAGEVFWFWIVSPRLQIRVWYLPNNHQSCYFLYISCIFCVV